MSFPSGVTTCTVTYGSARSIVGRIGSFKAVTVSCDRKIVHAATGEPLYPHPVDVTPDPGMPISFEVPHVDQAGIVDAAGNAVTGWTYTLAGALQVQGSKSAKLLEPRVFQVLLGQDLVDLDLVPDGVSVPGFTAPSPAVLMVAGFTGSVTAEQLASALFTETPPGSGLYRLAGS